MFSNRQRIPLIVPEEVGWCNKSCGTVPLKEKIMLDIRIMMHCQRKIPPQNVVIDFIIGISLDMSDSMNRNKLYIILPFFVFLT